MVATFLKRATRKKCSFQSLYIKSIVYGGLDGIVSTFAVVAGGTGASLAPMVLLIIGCADLIADGISMSVGDYMSSRAHEDYYNKMRSRHEKLFEKDITTQKERIEKLFLDKNFNTQESKIVANAFLKDKDSVVDLMLAEHGVFECFGSAIKKGCYTFCSFITFGCVPLLTYVILPHVEFVQKYPFIITSVLTGCTLFCLGLLKGIFTKKNWLLSALEMVGIGGFAAFVAFYIGKGLSSLLG